MDSPALELPSPPLSTSSSFLIHDNRQRMEVDPVEGSNVPKVSKVFIALDSPFDLDQVSSYYEGRTKINRLRFIAETCPQLTAHALSLALATIMSSTLDHALYETVYTQYHNAIKAIASEENKDPLSVAWYEGPQKANPLSYDKAWAEKAKREAESGLDKLEVELKGYTTNLIKESIRMGHRDLARFQFKTGDSQGAIRSYTKSREFCTTSQHVLELCIGVVEVSLELNNYGYVRNYVTKAESALEAAHAPPPNAKVKQVTVNLPGMVAPAMDPVEAAKEKEKLATQERLAAAGGVAYLGTGAYEKAAFAFTSLGKEVLSTSMGHFVPPADIAIYAVLCGLATFSRSEIRRRILENSDLRPMLDLEPWLRDVLRSLQNSNFKDGLSLLETNSTRLQLDIHLSQHVPRLLDLIRSRAILAYFAPFATVSLSRMATAFGWTETALTTAVIELIGTGQMKARIDSKAGVLVAKKKDVRGDAFKHALEEGERLQRRVKAVGLRMRLIKADIVVKPAKGDRSQAADS